MNIGSKVLRSVSLNPTICRTLGQQRAISLYRNHPPFCSCCTNKNEPPSSKSFSTFDSSFATDEDSIVSSHVRTLLENNRKWVSAQGKN
jgi:hypothetical protein